MTITVIYNYNYELRQWRRFWCRFRRLEIVHGELERVRKSDNLFDEANSDRFDFLSRKVDNFLQTFLIRWPRQKKNKQKMIY